MTDNPSAAVIYRTQLEAVEYLQAQGYKISKSKLSLDLRKKRLPTTPEGGFEASALLGYARTHCTPLARAEDQNESSANLERIKADAANKQAMAERNRLKLERERGNLMPRDEHELDLAARAAFFRREVETLGQRLGPRLIHLVGGDENRLPDFLEFWQENTEIWMDAWSEDREFAVPLNEAESEETSAPADLSEDSLEDLDDESTGL
ncbi:hypothetical protein LJB86_02750 [Deltaproteobacteria bacterium OttesenSCG-928-M10]|nr:hypothetical protein [Deltaproteobacteria bacterium OttesenSCG-928-M10]